MSSQGEESPMPPPHPKRPPPVPPKPRAHDIEHNAPPSALKPDVIFGIVISNSRLDDELLVATIELSDTPKWLLRLSRDTWGFPKKTDFGTLWKGVDRTAVDDVGQTEFIRAVCGGGANLLYAEMLAEFDDTDVNIQDSQDRTALHWASVGGHADMVRLCLSVPECVVGLKDKDGFTAFDLSVRAAGRNEFIPNLFYKSMFELQETHPQEALLRVLTVTSEPDVEGKPAFPGTAMFGPVGDQNGPLVEALINRGVNLTAKNKDGDTALHVAARVGNVGIASMLLEAGADVNAKGNGGVTPSQCVAQTSDKRMEEVLLDWEEDAAAKGGSGLTKMQRAEESKKDVENEQLEEKEQRNKDGLTTLLQAVMDGNLASVRSLVEMGADMEAEDGRQQTAVQMAVRQGHIDLVEILLHGGARTDLEGEWKESALLLAAEYGKDRVIEILLNAGAAVQGPKSATRSPLHLAAANGHTNTVQILLRNGAQIEMADHMNETALHDAAMAGHTGIVEALLNSGAEINVMGVGGTALHMASTNGHQRTIEMLLDRGAEIEAVDKANETALHSAAAAGHLKIVQVLLDQGARVDAQGRRGTPMQLATQFGHLDTVQIFKDAETHRPTREHRVNYYTEREATTSLTGFGLRDRYSRWTRSEK